MDKVYVCIRYDFNTNESTFASVKETKFEGDNGLVHLQSLNTKDTIAVKGQHDLGTRKVAKITF